jgi:hypothetical protein
VDRQHKAAGRHGPFQEQVLKEDPMDATDVAQKYFDAWNRRDPEAIVATFAEGGTYTDPNAPKGSAAEPLASTRLVCSRPSPTSLSTF